MVLEVTALAVDFLSRNITIRRYPATGPEGTYDENTGRWNPNVPWGSADPVEQVIRGRTCPVKAEAKNRMEGLRTDASFYIFTRFGLQVTDETTGQKPDEVLINGEWYRVIDITSYLDEGGWLRATLGKVDDRGRGV